MRPDAAPQTDGDDRVVPFRRREVPRDAWRRRSPVEDLRKYERPNPSDDDYRHRMTMNLLAVGVTIVLMAVGMWLASSIADTRKNQDCFLSGLRNCTPIEAGPTERG